MTIKEVEIELNHQIGSIEARKVFQALLAPEDLKAITFQAVKIRRSGVPALDEEVEAARKLRVTTADLSPEEADSLVSRIILTAEKFSLGTLVSSSIFNLQATPNPPRFMTE